MYNINEHQNSGRPLIDYNHTIDERYNTQIQLISLLYLPFNCWRHINNNTYKRCQSNTIQTFMIPLNKHIYERPICIVYNRQ